MRVRCVPNGMKSLQELLWAKGVNLTGDCGGRGRCGKCRVRLVPDGKAVLACQFVPEHRVTVEVEQGFNRYNARVKRSRSVPSPMNKDLVLVADIGTTTLRLSVIDQAQGRRIKTETRLNPQIRFGTDVLTRIGAASKVQRAGLNESLQEFMNRNGVPCSSPVTVVGNTVMMHFVFGKSPRGLGQFPYRTRLPLKRVIQGARNGLKLRTLPLLGSFIGSDCTAAIFAAGIHKTERLTLLVDAGTNGEVVLGNQHKIVACSTAAGPAFEGATLSCGVLAVPGAIKSCRLRRGRWVVKTVGSKVPTGICGSGVLDAVAEALRAGLIEPGGRLNQGERLQIYGKEPAGVYLTQADIREVQLAKAAIATGIKLLWQEWSGRKIERVVITGRFGGKLNHRAAMAIGLLPVLPESVIYQKPDLALAGAIKAVLEPEVLKQAEELSNRVTEIRLAEHPDFEKMFVESLALTEWHS